LYQRRVYPSVIMVSVNKIKDPTDLKKAFAIREKVFVDEQKVPADAEYDAHEDTAHHYLAQYAGVPCGAARWRKTPYGIKLERFAVLPSYRNQAVGSEILKQVLQDIKAAYPDEQIYLHAQVPAMPFYARQGFAPIGEKFSECDIEHYKMILRV